jgi:hypothetical protein
VIVSLTPFFTGSDLNFYNCLQALFHVPHAALLLGFAIAIPVMTRGGATRTSCQRLLYGGFAAVAATALAQFMDVFYSGSTSRPWLLLQGVGNVLMNAAAPAVWGLAMARRQNLQDDRLPRVARLSGLVALSGLTLYFVCDLAKIVVEGPAGAWEGTTPMLLVSTMIQLLARGSLIWASIESCRTPLDEASTLPRLDLTQGLMFGWLVGSGLGWACRMVLQLSDSRMLVWHMVVQTTLLLTVTLLVSLAAEQPVLALEVRPKGPFFPEPPPPADNSPIDVP